MTISAISTSQLFSRHAKKLPRCAQAVKLSGAIWNFYAVFCTSFRLCVPIFMQIGRQELYFFAFRNFEKNNKQISRGIKFRAIIFRAFAGTNFASKLIFSNFAELFFAACQENQYFLCISL